MGRRGRQPCAPDCGCGRHARATGSSLTATGYRFLTQDQRGHELARQNNAVFEHRRVLFEKIGPGSHLCHWNHVYECGRTELVWGGLGGNGIVADHLDDDRLNNAPENLVPSCCGCNIRRGRPNELTAVQVREIRAMAATLSYREIGELYGMAKTSIGRIVRRESWKNVV